MKKAVAVLTFLSLLSVFGQQLFSYNWPVVEPVITSTFGGDKWETFDSGIELVGDGLEVRPSADGEIIFYEDASSYSVMPSGLGNFAVIEHDRKLRTLYASIEPAEHLMDFESITAADIIGKTGSSGKAVKPHLYFAVIDSEFEQFVNPLLLLNSIADNKAPVINEIGIGSDAGYVSVDRKAVINAGKAEILADIWDPCMSPEYHCRMAPFKIHLFLNGEEIFYVNFESMVLDGGEAVIQSQDELRYTEFYREDGLVSLGEITLVPGDSRFEILVSDYTGNETGRSFQLTVVE